MKYFIFSKPTVGYTALLIMNIRLFQYITKNFPCLLCYQLNQVISNALCKGLLLKPVFSLEMLTENGLYHLPDYYYYCCYFYFFASTEFSFNYLPLT